MKLAYKKTGYGYPVVILHGLYGSGDNWFGIANNLAKIFEVFLPDHRNHGRSPHTDEINYDLLTSDLEEFYSEHNLQETFLIGHSMGGKAAMNFSFKNPGKVKKLVVVDIAIRSYDLEGEFAPQAQFHRKIIKTLLSIDIVNSKSRTEIDNYLATFIGDSSIRQFLLKNLKRNSNGSFYWGINLQSLDKNVHKLLGAVNTQNKHFDNPTLLISGKKSGYIKPGDIKDFNTAFNNFRHIELDAGHWIHAEQAEKFMAELEQFLMWS